MAWTISGARNASFNAFPTSPRSTRYRFASSETECVLPSLSSANQPRAWAIAAISFGSGEGAFCWSSVMTSFISTPRRLNLTARSSVNVCSGCLARFRYSSFHVPLSIIDRRASVRRTMPTRFLPTSMLSSISRSIRRCWAGPDSAIRSASCAAPMPVSRADDIATTSRSRRRKNHRIRIPDGVCPRQ